MKKVIFGCLLTIMMVILGSKGISVEAASKISLMIDGEKVNGSTYSVTESEKVSLLVNTGKLKNVKKITFKSTSKSVASVTKDGVIEAKKEGSAKIKVTVKYGNKTKKAWVKILVEAKKDVTDNEQFTNKKTLVVYFSATGNTAPLAQYAADILNADMYEIVPLEPYTDEDLAYYTDCRADREQNDPNARPAIKGSVEDMSKYDTIVIGHPIWHGQAPRIISTFLECYDFSGKTLVTFCTSHSSGLGSSADNLHLLVPESVTWLKSKRFPIGASKDDIKAWLDEIIDD